MPTVTIRNLNNHTISTTKVNQDLLSLLRENHLYINSPCGGTGTCGKCLVYLVEKETMVQACQKKVTSDMTIEITLLNSKANINTTKQTSFKPSENKVGLAIDLGTTTLAFYFMDLVTKDIIYSTSAINNQIAYGADVISRINQSIQGNFEAIFHTIISQINQEIDLFLKKYRYTYISQMVVSGNPTMIHILNHTNPHTIGFAPYNCVFTNAIFKKGSSMLLQTDEVSLLPLVSAFIGSDLVAGIISSKMMAMPNSLLIDLGTNGEMILHTQDELFGISTATGPAFEGASIEMGLGGVDGAINHVEYKDNFFTYSTVSGQARGITGSGLIDAVAICIKEGFIDETGALSYPLLEQIPNIYHDNRIYINKDVYISQKDIREFQLAKSAIRAGIESLLSVTKVSIKALNQVYIAGGFGFYLNIKNAITCGMFPKEFEAIIVSIGNASGFGSQIILTRPDEMNNAIKIAKEVKTIELTKLAMFSNLFIEHMLFE